MFDFDDLPDTVTAARANTSAANSQPEESIGESCEQTLSVEEPAPAENEVTESSSDMLSGQPEMQPTDVEASGGDKVNPSVDDCEPQFEAATADPTLSEFEKPPGLPEPHQRNKQPRDLVQPSEEAPLDLTAPQCAERSSTPQTPLGPETSASSEQTDMPASNMANTSRSLVEESGETARGMTKSNSDIVTPEMLQQLSDFMNKRAKMASDAVFETFKERLPHVLDANVGRSRSNSDREVSAHSTLKGVIKDTSGIIEQLAKGEKAASASLKQMSDPELMKQSKPLKASVEKVVSHWRDGVLNKTVLKAVESKPFADEFAEGLLAANSSENSALFAALKPSKEQIQEGLHEELRQWCGALVTKYVKGGLMHKKDLLSSKSAFDMALQDVSRQTVEMFTKFLQDTEATSKAPELFELCVKEVTEKIGAALSAYRRSPPPPPLPTATSPLSLGQSSARDSFSMTRRMRTMAAPLQKELDSVENEITSAFATLDRCRAKAKMSDSVAVGGLLVGGSSSSSLADARKSTLEDLASGRLLAAFQTALQWDSDHTTAETSLVEVACDQLQNMNGSEAVPPEEVLARPDVASQLDGRTKSLLILDLLERVASERKRNRSVARIEANLEWVLGLLQTMPHGEPGVVATLESMRRFLTTTLDGLGQGTHLEHIQASSDEKKRIMKSARLASKGLGLILQRR